MPRGDDEEIVGITRTEWNSLVDKIDDMWGKLCGDSDKDEDGMFKEHNEMFRWYLEQKWWNKKTVSLISSIGGVLGTIGMVISIILNGRKL